MVGKKVPTYTCTQGSNPHDQVSVSITICSSDVWEHHCLIKSIKSTSFFISLLPSPLATMNNVFIEISTTDNDEAAESNSDSDEDINLYTIKVPTGTYGFVYMLSSCRDFSMRFISQTSNLNHRLCQHNRENHPFKMDKTPYFVVSYMSYLNNNELAYTDRVDLQQRWIDNCATIVPSDDNYQNLRAVNYQGYQIMKQFNSTNADGNDLRFFSMVLP